MVQSGRQALLRKDHAQGLRHESQGQGELQSALQSLHAWIENILTSRSAEAYWHPNKQIRSEIENTLALMTDGERAQILTNADWLGAEVEAEIERVRREDSQPKD